jgi:hypothetical protein
MSASVEPFRRHFSGELLGPASPGMRRLAVSGTATSTAGRR